MPIFIVVVLCLMGPLPVSNREEIRLSGNAQVRGTVLKETADALFVDLGYTVLSIPKKEIVRRQSIDDAGASPTAAAEGSADAMFIEGAGGSERSISELSAALGSSVVLVTSPSKAGSGFFVNREGVVVTNYHVIEGERHITLTIFEKKGEVFERRKVEDVRIVAINPYYDLAVLQVGAKSLEELGFVPAPLGDGGGLDAGEQVFAIGNPHRLERTVTQGIVSTKARAFEGLLYIQTTAQINPGNSGGPLFNLRGEVVGVTNMKMAQFSEGLGFAIPVHRVKEVLQNLEAFAFDADTPNTGYRYPEPLRPTEKAR